MNAFGKTHYLLLTVSAMVAVLGLYLLSTGLTASSATVAGPIVLFLAYVVMIPASFLWPTEEKKQEVAGQKSKS